MLAIVERTLRGQRAANPSRGPARVLEPRRRAARHHEARAELGHTNAEMVYRRYHRFIPNLRGRDGALAAKGLADEGL